MVQTQTREPALHSVAVTVNGTRQSREVEPRQLLVYFLREQLGLTCHSQHASRSVRAARAGNTPATAAARPHGIGASRSQLPRPSAGRARVSGSGPYQASLLLSVLAV